MAEWGGKAGVEIWGYCLMPNHVHLIAVPRTNDALRAGIGEAHRRYTRRVNARENWRGCLWQGRFASFIMDEARLLTCARYVETNPVRAGLAERPEDWPWSSARAHLEGRDDVLVKVTPLLSRVPYSWREFLELSTAGVETALLRRHERTGRPLGSKEFVKTIERRLKRPLLPQKPGPKPAPK
jgi:putative transposase